MDLFNPTKKCLAIIGTAGRGDDRHRLQLRHWRAMMDAAREVIKREKVSELVSGGAAWADHTAVYIHNQDSLPLTLCLPSKQENLARAKYYHDLFGPKILGSDSWNEVLSLPNERFGGFLDCNTKVANLADVYLAMTFGDGCLVKDGGTAHTVRLMDKRGVPGYHFDLNTFELHERI